MTRPSILRRIRNSLTRSPHKRRATIDISGAGFILTLRKREHRMRWAEVIRIDAGVRDYFTFDGLYVVLFGGNKRLEVDELDDGFRQFENALCDLWPGTKEKLNGLLARNPHEPQHETLWQR